MFKVRINKSIFFAFFLLFILNSCAGDKNKISKHDTEKFLIKNQTEEKLKRYQDFKNESAVPRPSNMISIAPPPKIQNNKTMSFSVTDEVPLKDVLIELGRAAKIDVDLDPTISGGIVISAYNRPLSEIIDRIAALGSLRYSYINGILHFEPDNPYSKTYFVDFLIDGALWGEVESNITAILGRKPATSADSARNNGPTVTVGSSSFSSNKSAGIISVFANDREQKEIAQFLDEIYKNSSAQVLIEAKLVQVQLNKDHEAGIQWTFNSNGASIVATNPITSTTSPFSLTIPAGASGNIALQIQALEQFGVTKTISSPRINAMNNQKASLNFTKSLIYFTLSSSATSAPTTASTANTVTTINATKNEIAIGVQISIVPSINLRTNEITLDIKPKLTTDTGETVKDPTPISVMDSNGKPTTNYNTIPKVETQQLDTIAKVKSGDVLVIGGLMQETANDSESGIPFVSTIPLIGNLFKSTSKKTSMVETVIFIKATIINNNNAVPRFDRELHDKFTGDRREYLR